MGQSASGDERPELVGVVNRHGRGCVVLHCVCILEATQLLRIDLHVVSVSRWCRAAPLPPAFAPPSVYTAYARLINGMATLRTGMPPGVIPFSCTMVRVTVKGQIAPRVVERFAELVCTEERMNFEALARERVLHRCVMQQRDAVIGLKAAEIGFEPV